jgi:hypothetical protein
MASTVTNTYAVKATVAITLTSLGAGLSRESAVISNTTDKFLDVLIRLQSKGSGAGNTNVLNVYVYTALGDTTYTDGATGSDAAFTTASIKNAVFLDTVQMNGTTAVNRMLRRSIASVFGGIMPEKWGLFVHNADASNALSGTGGDHVVEYQGLKRGIA